jgi:hypothetical protein
MAEDATMGGRPLAGFEVGEKVLTNSIDVALLKQGP